MKNDLEMRRENYFALNTYLSHLDANQMRALFGDQKGHREWGVYHVIKVGNRKVFVKRVLVTDLEYENMYSTKNYYQLPTYFNYGVGSMGLGISREVTALIKTTNAVLSGDAVHFPILYHHRVVPYVGELPEQNMERHEGFVRYWNSNKQVGQYRLDRAQAKYELVMFFEYIPHALWRWFDKHMDQVDMVIEGMRDAISYLVNNEVVHFDCHWGNIMTDGQQVYLADFGLVLEKRFQLNKREQDFFRRHKYYDAGKFLSGLGGHLSYVYFNLSQRKKDQMAKRYGIEEKMPYRDLLDILLARVEHIHADGLMKLHPDYIDRVLKYKPIISLMNHFSEDLANSKRKNTKFPQAKLQHLLKDVGFVV